MLRSYVADNATFLGAHPAAGVSLDLLKWRHQRTKGGNTYKMVGLPNQTVDGRPTAHVVANAIDWEFLKRVYPDVDPTLAVRLNSARVKRRFEPYHGPVKEEPIAIVAFGGSLRDTWREIADFKTVITCSGSHRFLLERGIRPTYHIDSDPRSYKVDLLGTPHIKVNYLLASIVHPSYVEKLAQYNIERVELFHLLFYEPDIYAAIPRQDIILTDGVTIGPRCVKIARLMGYVNHHYFGFDASSEHASPHPNAPQLSEVVYDGKSFMTTSY